MFTFIRRMEWSRRRRKRPCLGGQSETAIKTAKDLIALAKASPESSTPERRAMVRRRTCRLRVSTSRQAVSITHVPYRGGVPSLTAAVAGEVQLVFSDIVPVLPQIRDNRLNCAGPDLRFGVSASLPTFRLLDESGLPGFTITAWVGVVTPKGTPLRHHTKAEP